MQNNSVVHTLASKKNEYSPPFYSVFSQSPIPHSPSSFSIQEMPERKKIFSHEKYAGPLKPVDALGLMILPLA